MQTFRKDPDYILGSVIVKRSELKDVPWYIQRATKGVRAMGDDPSLWHR
jgi:hypothetical protein